MTLRPTAADSAENDLDQVRDSLRAIIRRFGVEYWRETDRTRAYPREFMATMGEAGYFGALIPSAYGGLEVGPEVASVVVEEINRAGGDAATVNAQLAIPGTLVRHGSEEQKKKYLPGIASGEIRLLTVAATEPDSGADMSDLKSTARREGTGWILNAHKVLVSLLEYTDLMMLLVKTSEGPTLFLLPMAEHKERMEKHPI